MKIKRIITLFFYICCVSNVFSQANTTPLLKNIAEENRVNDIIAKMSIDEKLSQLTGIRSNELMVDGKLSIEKCKKMIPFGIGHISQFASSVSISPELLRVFVRDLQSYLVNETPNGIPAILHEETITGFATYGATTFPQQIGMGCTWNPEIVKRNTQTTSKMMRQVGGTQALSPMMDIANNANWGRLEESYGEDPYLTSQMGLAFVNGLQGDNLRTGVAATTKHFAGYGGVVEDMREFYEETLMPHEVLIKTGGVRSVMPGYHQINGVPCAADKWLLQNVLRDYLGFDGTVVSDYGAVRMVNTRYKYTQSFKETAVLALKAGNDIELEKPICTPFLKEALSENLVTMKEIDVAVKRVLLMKARLGLLDKDVKFVTSDKLDFDSPEQRKMAYESAAQSIVLLKNNGVLPLKKVGKVALVGPNANSFQSLLGDYTFQSIRSFFWNTPFIQNNPKLVTLFDGLKAKLPNHTVLQLERGCDWSAPMENSLEDFGDARVLDAKQQPVEEFPVPDLQKALAIAQESDVIIAAMGENLYLCGEGRQRNGIKLPGEQEKFVKKLLTLGKPVVLVIFGGRPQVIAEIEKDCAAVIHAWFPGEEGGNAVADILLGNICPTAKLCISYPSIDEKRVISHSRGYNQENAPQYPFGYGLSYNTYSYSDFKVAENAKLTDESILVSCNVTNNGVMDGAEIVQLYVSYPDKSFRKQYLKGFQRLTLKKGETKKMVFKVSPKQFASYKSEKWVIEPGNYTFKIGASSTDIKFEKKIELIGRTIKTHQRECYFSSNN